MNKDTTNYPRRSCRASLDRGSRCPTESCPHQLCCRIWERGLRMGVNGSVELMLSWPGIITSPSTERGSHLLDPFEEMVILNDPYSPTRRPRRVGERVTAPDIAFCPQDLSPLVQWKVVPDLSSDHNPILIDIAILSLIPKNTLAPF